MTMEGVGKGTRPNRAVLAVLAGADILLKPTDPTRAIDARRRCRSAARFLVPGSTARYGMSATSRRVSVLRNRFVDLDALRDVVGSPAHRALAADIAQRAVTLLRDRDALVPMKSGRALVVQYAPETELKAGRVLGPALISALPQSRVVKISPTVTRPQLDSIAALGQGLDRIVVAAYVRRVEGEGRFACHSTWLVDRFPCASDRRSQGRGRRVRESVSDSSVPERRHVPGDVRRIG